MYLGLLLRTLPQLPLNPPQAYNIHPIFLLLLLIRILGRRRPPLPFLPQLNLSDHLGPLFFLLIKRIPINQMSPETLIFKENITLFEGDIVCAEIVVLAGELLHFLFVVLVVLDEDL